MDVLLYSIERSALGIWMRESLSVLAFPTVLALHTVGLAFLAGPNVALDLRILGVAREAKLSAFARLFPFMWAGFWLNLTTGLMLFVAYPTKAVTNPVFYLKMGAVFLGIMLLRRLRAVVAGPHGGGKVSSGRGLAIASIAAWTTALFAGRLLAYTYNTLFTYLD